jgi:hypothetical protein
VTRFRVIAGDPVVKMPLDVRDSSGPGQPGVMTSHFDWSTASDMLRAPVVTELRCDSGADAQRYG